MKSGNLATKRFLRSLGLNQLKSILDEIGLNDYDYMIIVLHFHEKKDLFSLSRLTIEDMQKFYKTKDNYHYPISCEYSTMSERLCRILTRITQHLVDKLIQNHPEK